MKKRYKELPKGLTDEEQLRVNEIYQMGRITEPPEAPVRNVAEFERMQGVLIRYPFGISTAMIAEMSMDVQNILLSIFITRNSSI